MPRRVASPHIVGRARELRELRALLDEALGGAPAVALVGGDAGIGKTRLLDELADAVRDTVRVLVGRCVEVGAEGVPFAPLTEIFRQVANDVEPHRVAQVLGPARSALAALAPQLGAARIDGTEPLTQPALFSWVVDAFERLARDHPLIVVVEDLHWADRSTLDLVTYVARNLRDAPLLVVATFRTDELHRQHPLRPVLGELTRLPAVMRMDLAPLTAEEVAAQVTGIVGEQPTRAQVDELAARSDGNPFYVEELLATGATGSTVPAALHDVVAARLQGLPEATRRLLGTAATIGQTVPARLLEVLTDEAHRLDALRTAVDHHILIADADDYRFRHALVREVVYDELLPSERVTLHRVVAEALTRHPELASQHVDAELAYHWSAAHDTVQAFGASLRAARRAHDSAAFAESLRHYERALSLWDAVEHDRPTDARSDVLEAAADAAVNAGEYRRSAAHLREALAGAAGVDEARLRHKLAQVTWNAGDEPTATAEAERAAALVADAPPSPTKVRALTALAVLRLNSVRHDAGEAVGPAREAVAAAAALGEPLPRSHALATLGAALTWTGDLDDAIEHLEEALSLARDLDDPHATSRAFNNLYTAVYARDLRDGTDASAALADDVLAWLDAGGERWLGALLLLGWPVYGYLRGGLWEAAERVVERMAGAYREGVDDTIFRTVRATLWWMQGRLDDAAADVGRLRDAGIMARWYHDVFPLEAEIAAAQGRLDDVRAIAHEHVAADVTSGERAMKVATLRPLVRAEVDAACAGSPEARDDHVRRAAQTLETMREIVQRHPPSMAGTIQLELIDTYIALAEAELSRATAPAPDLWRSLTQSASFPYWRLYAGWRLAEALLELGDHDDAAETLRDVHRRASELGAGGIVRDVETLARRGRIDLPGVRRSDASDFGLTSREIEVLRLVARGMTNNQIGETLYIAPKTASVHVSNILAKLGVDNRGEAAAIAHDAGLAGGG